MDTNTWYEIIERFGEQIDLVWTVGISLIAATIFVLSGIIQRQPKDCKDHIIITILIICILAYTASAALGYFSRSASVLVLECVGNIEAVLCETGAECRDGSRNESRNCNRTELTKHYGSMESIASLQVLAFALGVLGFLFAFVAFPRKMSQAMRRNGHG